MEKIIEEQDKEDVQPPEEFTFEDNENDKLLNDKK